MRQDASDVVDAYLTNGWGIGLEQVLAEATMGLISLHIADAVKVASERVGVFATHLAKVGRGLDTAVGAYNQAVSSFESRLLVTARKFPDHGIGGDEPPELAQIERMPVAPTAPELAPVDDVAALPRAS